MQVALNYGHLTKKAKNDLFNAIKKIILDDATELENLRDASAKLETKTDCPYIINFEEATRLRVEEIINEMKFYGEV